MELHPLKTTLIRPKDDLIFHLKKSLKKAGLHLKEGDILVIASKAVSYAEGRLKSCCNTDELKTLVQSKADRIFGKGEMVLTLKNKILIPNAGIDQSNAPKGYTILWPKDPFKSARQLITQLKKEWGFKKLGVLISDSNIRPLRRGTVGIALGWAGFEGIRDYRGASDLFGKKMKYSTQALADNLASAAELLMGNANEQVPFVLMQGARVKFTNKPSSSKDYVMRGEECLYRFYGK